MKTEASVSTKHLELIKIFLEKNEKEKEKEVKEANKTRTS